MEIKIMQIKRIYHCFTRTLSMMLGCMLALTACVNEEVLPSPGEQDKEMVTLSMEMTDRSGVPGSDSEIKKVRFIAFDSRNGGFIYNTLFDNPATMPVKIKILSGTRDFYAITNEPSGQTAALNNVRSLEHLQAVRIPYDEVEQGTTFVTFGSLSGKVIKPKVANEITIRNYRLAVKIELTLNGKNFTPANEVSFKNLPDAIPLFDVPHKCDADDRKTKTVTSLTTPDAVSPGYVWTRTATIVLPSYIFDPETDISKAVRISTQIGSAEIGEAIGHNISAKDYTLHRNTIYSLNAGVGSDKLVIDAQVKKWESNYTEYPAGGGSFRGAQPQDKLVGLNGTTSDATGVFVAGLTGSGKNATFKWYRKKQLQDFSFETTEITTGIVNESSKSTLTLVATTLEDACEVYCIATVTAQDGKTDRLESERATFMVVGDWKPTGTYLSMQDWEIPMNVPFGSTCLLQDDRDKKVYRVKLMADGNWWMVQDLAYGNASTKEEFDANCANQEITGLIEDGLYGVCTSSGLPTGGYLYNAYAALQFKGDESELGGGDLKREYLHSLCPKGWHLPGNANKEYNQEWATFIEKTGINLLLVDDIERCSYNHPTAFNAYNVEPDRLRVFTFHGGYRVGKSDRTKPVDFLTLGIAATGVDSVGGIFLELGDRNPNHLRVPIRCLRNFK